MKLIIDDLKIVLHNADVNLLSIYVRKATTLITNYLNSSTALNMENDYADAVIEYVTICINKRGNEGIKQYSKGSRSGTYGNELPDSVVALLPVPYATLLQTTIDCVEVILP